MDSDIFREVRFDKYCETCKYKDLDEVKDPCNDCLTVGMREETEVPEFYEEASAAELRKRKRAGT